MKKGILLLHLFLLLASPSLAITLSFGTDKDLLLQGDSAIVATVVDVKSVAYEDGFPYAELDVRVDEVIGTKDPAIKAGQILQIFVGISVPASLFDGKKSFTAPEDTKVDIHLNYQRGGPSLDRVRDAVVGKQFLFSHKSIWLNQILLDTLWPLSANGWVRSCWAGAGCTDFP